MKCELGSICSYRREKIRVSELDSSTYISTENMIPNKGGITQATSLPTSATTQKFNKGDILVSNIRPYFKKIWQAKFDGGCSNDVLVFRANEGVDPTFLYYVLADDEFFSYSNATSKGTKMPRGDKNAIMQYCVPQCDIVVQRKIAETLHCLDEKIRLNMEINTNLQQQAFCLFDQLLTKASGESILVSDIADLNPKRALTKNQIAKCIDMAQLSTSGAFPDGWVDKPFKGGMRFANGDTLLARITPCLENGKTAFIDFLNEGEVAFGSTEYIVLSPKEGIPPEFLYCLARYPAFVDYAVKNMNGSSGRQRVSAETIGQYSLTRLSDEQYQTFGELASPMFRKMKNNWMENMRLAEVRDALLPKLMSGELNLSDI